MSDSKSRTCLCSLFVVASLFCGAYFIGSGFIAKEYNDRLSRWEVIDMLQSSKSAMCKVRCRPPGSEALPEGIVVKTSNLEMRPLWSDTVEPGNLEPSANLLAIAVGIKQKEIVDRIIKKFPARDFVVMLFHYDGVVDEWRDLEWNDRAIHLSAVNQTKWWFAKRFLHPDIVSEYKYVFLWDEDLGVDNFDPTQYLSIVEDEGLEISQPALDPAKSDVHHQITARKRNSKLHRRIYKFKGSGRCDSRSTAPPCIGWVEMMAPVFSRAAWRCAWYMIQNDLIHAWGLDKQLGYCAQGDRMKNVGVVDAQYIVHLGLPTLGVVAKTEASIHRNPCKWKGILNSTQMNITRTQTEHLSNQEASAPSESHTVDNRPEVRRQSFIEMQTFRKRWENAVKEDKCWIDPYPQSSLN
ncbi:pentatricopeptide repeat-containing protein [Hibiscus syriacus]|uniref:Pentatricopeptide repeat-containing protein n=1 Tax=Hibiscus syriacus TaxID=106335 RepID=A0A6A3C7T3_HIBSY|nr:pentatricopeptide repeat-containing protein [Hibiscus syriacus]